jgi:flagellar biosynthesis/type III secretory pathway protein FliH
MKMSKAERKAYKLGRQVGRAEGYADGLYDGNPFNTIAAAINKAFNSMADKLSDPEFIEYLKTLNEEAEKVEEEEECKNE